MFDFEFCCQTYMQHFGLKGVFTLLDSWYLRVQLCRLISFKIDTLHNFDEVGEWGLWENDHFFAYDAINLAEPAIDDHYLAEREKQHLGKQITDNVQFRK